MDDDIKFNERHPLLRYVIAGVVILIIAGFVTAIVIANNQNNNVGTTANKSQTSNSTKKTPATKKPAQTSSNQPVGGASGATSQPELSNSGPGNVVALFLGTTLIAGAIHYGFRRLQKS